MFVNLLNVGSNLGRYFSTNFYLFTLNCSAAYYKLIAISANLD